jgi:hypothetical protein
MAVRAVGIDKNIGGLFPGSDIQGKHPGGLDPQMLHVHTSGQSFKFLQAVYPLPVPDIEKLPLEHIPAVRGYEIGLVPFGADEIKVPEGEILFAHNLLGGIEGRGRRHRNPQEQKNYGKKNYAKHSNLVLKTPMSLKICTNAKWTE